MNSTDRGGRVATPGKSARELRKFGVVMAAPLTILGGLALWRGRPWGPWALGLAGLFLLLALLLPRALAPIEKGWMAFAKVLGVVMTYVILTLTYYLVITPVGLALRALGKDLLGLKPAPDGGSFWAPVDPDGPCGRPFRPY